MAPPKLMAFKKRGKVVAVVSKKAAPKKVTAKAVQKIVKKEIKKTIEQKHADILITKVGVAAIAVKDTTGGIGGVPGYETSGPFFSIAEGDDVGQRNGRKIIPNRLTIQGQFVSSTNVTNDRYIDVYLVRWNDYQTGGSVTLAINNSEFLEANLVNGFYDTDSYRNLDYKSFTVLKKKRIYIPAKQYQAATNSLKEFKMSYSFKGMNKILYNNTTTTSITEGAYYLLYFTNSGDSNVAVATGVEFNGQVRQYWKDI